MMDFDFILQTILAVFLTFIILGVFLTFFVYKIHINYTREIKDAQRLREEKPSTSGRGKDSFRKGRNLIKKSN